jgi:methyltransferase (TIGR00027 family)
MNQTEPLIRNISDTARWVAFYRARETERPDALFRDPFARQLAGERGEFIARAMDAHQQAEWPWVTRTILFDRVLLEQVKAGADLIVNLATGLDTRPYRLDLPSSLKWVEIDLPEILEYKEKILVGEKPRCQLQRIRLDLANAESRLPIFQQLGNQCRNACIMSEGLLIYLHDQQVAELARDLAAVTSFHHWITDLASPGLLKMLQKNFGKPLEGADSPLRFAPADGADFFNTNGWKPVQIHSMLKEAGRLKRLPWFLHLLSLLPSPKKPGNRPWSGICLLEKGQTCETTPQYK